MRRALRALEDSRMFEHSTGFYIRNAISGIVCDFQLMVVVPDCNKPHRQDADLVWQDIDPSSNAVDGAFVATIIKSLLQASFPEVYKRPPDLVASVQIRVGYADTSATEMCLEIY
jgi:hypothetical protein